MTEQLSAPEELRREVERRIAEEASQRPTSSEPFSALVRINIDPAAIPMNTADWSVVLELLSSEFVSRYNPSEIESLIPPQMRASPIEPESLITVALRNDRAIRFQGGRLRFRQSDTVTSIEQFAIESQNLVATVLGTTDEAMYLCQAVCLVLWQSTGINRKWAELDHYVNIVTYSTTTVEDLGISLLELLAPEVRSFLAEDIGDSKNGLGRQMGLFATTKPDSVKIIAYCREIDLRVAVIDEVSGEADDCILNFLLDTRGQANRGKAKVTSELPSARHTEMVNRLRKRFQLHRQDSSRRVSKGG